MYYVKIVTNVTMVTCSNNSGNEEEVKRIDEWRNHHVCYCLVGGYGDIGGLWDNVYNTCHDYNVF